MEIQTTCYSSTLWGKSEPISWDTHRCRPATNISLIPMSLKAAMKPEKAEVRGSGSTLGTRGSC